MSIVGEATGMFGLLGMPRAHLDLASAQAMRLIETFKAYCIDRSADRTSAARLAEATQRWVLDRQ